MPSEPETASMRDSFTIMYAAQIFRSAFAPVTSLELFLLPAPEAPRLFATLSIASIFFDNTCRRNKAQDFSVEEWVSPDLVPPRYHRSPAITVVTIAFG